MTYKKGQMEIMGLLVIVMLITVILMIIVTLDMSNTQNPQNEQTAFTQEQLIGTLGPTIMETTTECTANKKLIRELVAECAFSSTNCDDGSGLSSCEYLNKTIKEIASNTLDKAGLNYSLIIKSDLKVITRINHTKCDPTTTRKVIPKSTPIVTNYGPMELIIKICT